jgi:hypothetical protein
MELLSKMNKREHNFLPLADLKDMTEEQVKEHLKTYYSGTCSDWDEDENPHYDENHINTVLKNMNILIAYESEGSWGCDSSSFFLFEDVFTSKYYMLCGSHCSCYGFEGQFELEETNEEFLTSTKFYFCTGGYDEDGDSNTEMVKQYIEMYIKKSEKKLLN